MAPLYLGCKRTFVLGRYKYTCNHLCFINSKLARVIGNLIGTRCMQWNPTELNKNAGMSECSDTKNVGQTETVFINIQDVYSLFIHP